MSARVHTVLVVDDHADTREMLASVLQSMGFRVMEAGDGLEALDQTQRVLPDLVLLDYAMPRMDAVEFMYELRHDPRSKTIPVIGITGQGPAGMRAMTNAGATEVLAKPCDLDALRAAIARALALAA